MNKIIYSAALIAFLSFSCKEETTTEILPKGETIEEQLAKIPEIKSSNIEQSQVKKIDVLLDFKDSPEGYGEFELNLDYLEDGKLKKILNKANPMFDFEYSPTEITVTSDGTAVKYKLNEIGLADSDNNETFFYYKNNFLVFAFGKENRIFDYSTDGNLKGWVESLEKTATYTYTEFENNIRQEVLSPLVFHSTFRDSYLGNFSTNLIKKAVFKEGTNGDITTTTLDFDYVFDAQGRVSKVIIDRQPSNMIGSAIIEYSLSY